MGKYFGGTSVRFLFHEKIGKEWNYATSPIPPATNAEVNFFLSLHILLSALPSAIVQEIIGCFYTFGGVHFVKTKSYDVKLWDVVTKANYYGFIFILCRNAIKYCAKVFVRELQPNFCQVIIVAIRLGLLNLLALWPQSLKMPPRHGTGDMHL